MQRRCVSRLPLRMAITPATIDTIVTTLRMWIQLNWPSDLMPKDPTAVTSMSAIHRRPMSLCTKVPLGRARTIPPRIMDGTAVKMWSRTVVEIAGIQVSFWFGW